MTFRDYVRGKPKQQLIDEDTIFCIEWLESLGFVFQADFGFQNAKQVAVEVARERVYGTYGTVGLSQTDED